MFVGVAGAVTNEEITTSIQSTERQLVARELAKEKSAALQFVNTIDEQLFVCLMSVKLSITIINARHSLKNGVA